MCLSSLTVVMPVGPGADVAAAQAPSARHCATQRALGRYPPGCPRPNARQPVSRPSTPRPPAPRPPRTVSREPSLPANAIRMRNALAAVPESEWSRQAPPYPIDRRIWALGTQDDMRALAQYHNARAEFLLGFAYSRGQFGVRQNVVLAETWLVRAIQGGDQRGRQELDYIAQARRAQASPPAARGIAITSRCATSYAIRITYFDGVWRYPTDTDDGPGLWWTLAPGATIRLLRTNRSLVAATSNEIYYSLFQGTQPVPLTETTMRGYGRGQSYAFRRARDVSINSNGDWSFQIC